MSSPSALKISEEDPLLHKSPSTEPATPPTAPTPPPPPPPMPPTPSSLPPKQRSKTALKFRSAHPGWYFQDNYIGTPPEPDAAARTGYYFVYGTLMDPHLLAEILSLSSTPSSRPAQIIGYQLRMWGQYPALCNGVKGQIVKGRVYEITERKHGERLAEYETSAYRAAPVLIDFLDDKAPEQANGRAFVYAGREGELSGGVFDLGTWLRRIGRRRAADQLHVDEWSQVEAG